MHVTGDVFDCGGDGVVSREQRVYDDAETFHLEVGLVKGFEGTTIIEVMVEWDGEMRICDSGD